MESIGGDLKEMKPRPLGEDHLAAMRERGAEQAYAAGAIIARNGDSMDRFVLVLDGEVEVVDPFSGERMVPSTLGPGQFMGELAFLNGGRWTLPMRAARDTRTLEVPRPAMLQLMSEIPELGDHVITVYSARRRRQVEEGSSAIKLIGADRDPAIQRVASFLSRNRIPFQSYDLDGADDDSVAVCRLADHKPSVVFGSDTVIDDPNPSKLAHLLGLDLDASSEETLDLLIVGGGPAGVAAAVYAGAEGLKALVVEDTAIGGQAGTSSRIENYMGFPTGISGGDLIYRGQIQAMKFGTRFAMPRRVEQLAVNGNGVFCATLDHGDALCARAVLVATGVQYRRLPLPRIEELEGAGIFYAATEMEAHFCVNTDAVVVGGGNSAGQAAMFLSRHARHVHLLVRGDSLAESMSAYLRDRIEADRRITIHYRSAVIELIGEHRLEAIRIASADGERRLDCGAVFIMVGAEPNTSWLSGLVEVDRAGFIITGESGPYATSRPGIFAVGDVRCGSVKRVASAVGEGSVVVSAIWSYLNKAV